MAYQPFNRASAVQGPTCHYCKISHPSTVVPARLRGDAYSTLRSPQRRRDRLSANSSAASRLQPSVTNSACPGSALRWPGPPNISW